MKKYGINARQRQQFRRYLKEKRFRGMRGDAISAEELEELAREFLEL